jgi:hypothetical protein
MGKRIAAAALCSFAFAVAVAPMLHAAANRRLRARFDVTQTGDPVPDPRCASPLVLVSFTGSGHSTGAGRTTIDASHCIIDDPAEPDFSSGVATLSSARGDIFITYRGTDTAGVVDGTFLVTGGTGDFAGASGSGTLSGSVSTAGTGTIDLDGRLVLP